MMIIRQNNILQFSSLLLLLAGDVASISLSQFQKIQGFSKSCESVWEEDIPGCTKQDFASSDSCSRSCLAGVNIINAEVLVACSDAEVGSNTLLGEFLDGNGVSALCGGDATTTTTTAVVTSSGGDSTTAVAATTTTGLVSSAQQTTTTTTAAGSSTTISTQSAQPSPQSTTTAISTNTSSSSKSSSTTDPNLTIAFTGPTSTASHASTSSSSSSTSSTSSQKPDPEANGFGGVGNAFDILGGESSAVRLESLPCLVVAITAAMALLVAGGIW